MAYIDVTGMKAIIYARVSTDDKEQNPDVQVNLCQKWCDENGVDVIEAYRDMHTGKELNRPGFTALLGKIMLLRPSLLVVRDQSRLTRDMKIEQIKDILRPYGTSIIYAASPDIDPDSFVGNVIGGVEGAKNKEEVVLLSTKTKEGMADSRENGQHQGRPQKFIIKEDEDLFLKGAISETAKKISETVLFTYARAGRSLRYVAKMEEVKYAVFYEYLCGNRKGLKPGCRLPVRLGLYQSISAEPTLSERVEAENQSETDETLSERGVIGKGIETVENPIGKGGDLD